MNWDLVFSITNGWAILMWLFLALGPRSIGGSDWPMAAILYGGVGLLALSYALILIPLLTGMIDGGLGTPDFSTLAGVKQALSSDGGATIGWIHYLAFDLFVGIWISRNADRLGMARWMQVPILFFTLMVGPFGLTLYFLTRIIWHNKVAAAVIPQ